MASFPATEGKSSSKRGSALRAPRRICLRASMQIYRHAGMLAGICGRRCFLAAACRPAKVSLGPARAFKRSGRKAGQERGWDWPLSSLSGGSRPFRAWRRTGFGGLGRNWSPVRSAQEGALRLPEGLQAAQGPAGSG